MLRQFIVRFRNVAVVSAAAGALGVAALAACGVKGPLKLPEPAPAATGAPSPETPPAAATTAPTAKPPETKQ